MFLLSNSPPSSASLCALCSFPIFLDLPEDQKNCFYTPKQYSKKSKTRISCGTAGLCLVANREGKWFFPHTCHNFHTKPISTNVAAVTSLHLGQDQFDGLEMGMIW
jgi:hypothetical protein